MEAPFIVISLVLAFTVAVFSAMICIVCGHVLATTAIRGAAKETAEQFTARPLRVVLFDEGDCPECDCDDEFDDRTEAEIIQDHVEECFLEQEGLPKFLDPSEN